VGISIIKLQHPSVSDGMHVNRLIAECPPLDPNSAYCNLLQCSHFADTSIIAKQNDSCMGFVSGYLIPTRPEAVFVWQVAVAPAARGQRLASRMLRALLESEACRAVRYLETTITPDNEASLALFGTLAQSLDVGIEESAAFDKDQHFHGEHATEHLFRIGPFTLTEAK
jgi:L-2,4-diaminobutyric acid acetyltransferase